MPGSEKDVVVVNQKYQKAKDVYEGDGEPKTIVININDPPVVPAKSKVVHHHHHTDDLKKGQEREDIIVHALEDANSKGIKKKIAKAALKVLDEDGGDKHEKKADKDEDGDEKDEKKDKKVAKKDKKKK